MKSIAVIPARGGSVRIPKKNIKPLNGIPLIEYTIKQALDSGCFDRVIVSTDDSEIMLISVLAGAEVYHRPKHLAEDVKSELVIQNVVEVLEGEGYFSDIITMLQPTSPFRKPETIEKCIDKLFYNFNDTDSVITVSKTNYRPEWLCSLKGDNLIPYTNTWVDENNKPYIELVSSMDLPPLYQQNGCIYIFKRDLIIDKCTIIGPNCRTVLIDSYESFDLDTLIEWRVAEEMLRGK